MKKIYIAVSAILISVTVFSQSKFSSYYSLSIPQGEMNDNINATHSITLGYQYAIPQLKQHLVVGSEISYGAYSFVSKEQDLRFPDGTGTTTTVNYSSNVFSGALLTRVNLLRNTSINPYLNVKGSYAQFFSNITVEDPEDPGDCEVLERKSLIRDHTFFLAYGGGLQIDLSSFSKKVKRGKNIIDISVNKIRGGNLDYINTKKLQSHVHTDTNNPPVDDDKSKPLNIRFINVNSQVIHEHQVAEVYNSPLRMFDIKIGMVFAL